MAARRDGYTKPHKYTPAELTATIDDYFAAHSDKSNIPKWPDMLNHIGLSDDMLRLYRTEDKYIQMGYSDCVKKAERMFGSTLIQLGVDNPGLQPLVIFLLKQAHNGGYTDKPQQAGGNIVVELAVRGVD